MLSTKVTLQVESEESGVEGSASSNEAAYRRRSPELALLVAVLNRAIADLQLKTLNAEEYHAVHRWIRSDEVYCDRGISFGYICQQFDIEPEAIRKSLRDGTLRPIDRDHSTDADREQMRIARRQREADNLAA